MGFSRINMDNLKIEHFEGGYDRNISYLIVDQGKKIALVIDPFKDIGIYLERAKELKVEIKGVLNTHFHSDHAKGNPAFLKLGVKALDLEKSGKDKSIVESVGIKILKTPGHSDDSVCFYIKDKEILITGDTLFSRRVGISKNLKNSKILLKTLKKLIKLPGETKIHPGHSYSVPVFADLDYVKENNPYLQCKNVEEFEKLMSKWRIYTKTFYAKKKLMGK